MIDTIKIFSGTFATVLSAWISLELVVLIAQLVAAIMAIICGGITVYLFIKKLKK